MGAFKAYDIRGVFGHDWDLESAYQIGRTLPSVMGAKRLLIGRDCRESSPAIADALSRGLLEAGCDVDDAGLASTPMIYFFTAEHGYDGSVQITASHNPPDYNGLKVSQRGALPMGYDAGLNQVEARLLAKDIPPRASTPGALRQVDLLPEYVGFLKGKVPNLTGLRFAVDCSDGMGGLFARALFGDGVIYLNDRPDGAFPHHNPNPLEVENCQQLIDTVRAHQLDLGVIFDGDADRVMFVDDQGTFIQPDYLIPVIAKELDHAEPAPRAVIHDIRTSLGVIETLQEQGMQPVIGRVGHAYAKVLLRECGAFCGGELAGHYYFRDFHSCDSAAWAACLVLGAAAKAKLQGLSLHELMAPITQRYRNSGECNFKGISDKDQAIAALCQAVEAAFGAPLRKDAFDGVRLNYADLWLNVRPSNTEPCLRVVFEAKTTEQFASLERLVQETLA